MKEDPQRTVRMSYGGIAAVCNISEAKVHFIIKSLLRTIVSSIGHFLNRFYRRILVLTLALLSSFTLKLAPLSSTKAQ